MPRSHLRECLGTGRIIIKQLPTHTNPSHEVKRRTAVDHKVGVPGKFAV